MNMPMEKTRMKALNTLIKNGYDTEKKITALDPRDMVSLSGVTIPEVAAMLELQKAIKERKVIAYLSEGRDDEMNDSEDAADGQEEREKETGVSVYGGYY